MSDIENAIIGSLVVDHTLLAEIQDTISVDDFCNAHNRMIYQTICNKSEAGHAVDIITLAEAMNNLDYLTELTMLRTANIQAHAKFLADKGYKRRLLGRIDSARDEVLTLDDINDQQDAVSRITEGLEAKGESFKSFGSMAKDCILRLEERVKGLGVEGLATGYQQIDERLMGVGDDDLWIVGARPSMGKTTYAMNIAENVAKAGGNVLVFSMEMGEAQIMDRMLASLSGVPLSAIRRGKGLTEEQFSSINAAAIAMNRIKKNMLIIDRPGMDIAHLAGIAKKCNRKRSNDLIVIDYLQLMSAKAESRFQEISTISRGLKSLAKSVKSPVMALSQLSRAVDARTNSRPVNSDLRESGQIEQDADIIQFLYRDEVYNEKSVNKGFTEVITTKFRNGETGTNVLESQLDRSRFITTNRALLDDAPQQKRGYKID